MTGGVILSVIASPVVAAVSVGMLRYVQTCYFNTTLLFPDPFFFCPSVLGIGVPIMLAYVYGVVPVSLCRGGGCGVSTGNGKGVKIDFEDDGPITGNDIVEGLLMS